MSVATGAIFLVVASAASLLVVLSCSSRRWKLSLPLFLAGLALLSLLYFILSSHFLGIASFALLAGGSFLHALAGGQKEEPAGPPREERGSLLKPLLASAISFALLTSLSLALPWEFTAGDGIDGISSLTLAGDTIATSWTLPFEAAALVLTAGALGCVLILTGKGKR